MKKLFLYALTAVFALNLFAACSDDDDDDAPKKEAWEELSKTYSGSDLNLTLNAGMLVSYDERNVVVDATSATAATFILNNMVPDAKQISMPVALSQSGSSFNVTGSAMVNGTEITIAGTIDKDKAILGFTRKLAKNLPNSLKLGMNPPSALLPMPLARIYVDAETGDAVTDAETEQTVKMGLGILIGSKVSDVTISLAENGLFDASWIKVGETESTSIKGALAGIDPMMGAVLAQMLNIHYAVNDGKLYLALDKGLLSMIPEEMLGKLPIDLSAILGLLEDMGGFYGFPINYIESDGNSDISFYIQKDKFLQLMVPMLGEDTSEEVKQMLTGLLQSVAQAQKFDFGLIFE